MSAPAFLTDGASEVRKAQIDRDWTARRASYAYRRQGNRDLYLSHPSGAQAAIYPVGGEPGKRTGPYAAALPGGRVETFASRRAAMTFVASEALAAYEGDGR